LVPLAWGAPFGRDAMAEAEPPRSRSRSPKGAAAGESSVPSHWSKPAAAEGGAAASPAPAKKGKGGGKKGFRPGQNQEILADNRLEEEVTAASLLALAAKVEAKDADASPEDIAKALKKAAARLNTVEKNMEEIGETLRAVNTLTARCMATTGLLAGDMPTQVIVEGGNDGKSSGFLVKKADADVEEAHRLAAQTKPSFQGSTNAGGALGSNLSRAEMEAARKERLAKMEEANSAKSKEVVEAEAKRKAREKLFSSAVGPAKMLGQIG